MSKLDPREVQHALDEVAPEICDIPKNVCDWKVIQNPGSGKVWVESETIAHELDDFDDAWLEITGNMIFEEKLKLAQWVCDRLNRKWGLSFSFTPMKANPNMMP